MLQKHSNKTNKLKTKNKLTLLTEPIIALTRDRAIIDWVVLLRTPWNGIFNLLCDLQRKSQI